MADDHEAIHTYFGLSYANYLVIPRSVLQSMPDGWQKGFVDHLEEMSEAFDYLDWPNYDVRALRREPEMIQPMVDCEECNGEGIWFWAPGHCPEHGRTCPGHDCEYCDTLGEVEDPEGERYETPEEVGIRRDPIPPYERGRTRLEPFKKESE